MVLAIQTAVQNATTELSWDFNSMVNTGKFQFGCNDDGIHLLNTGDLDETTQYERSFTLATSDLGTRNHKHCRSIELGVVTDNDINIIIKADDGTEVPYIAEPYKTGLQRILIPIGSNQQGRYWTIKISSMYAFTIDQIDSTFIIRPLGLRG